MAKSRTIFAPSVRSVSRFGSLHNFPGYPNSRTYTLLPAVAIMHTFEIEFMASKEPENYRSETIETSGL